MTDNELNKIEPNAETLQAPKPAPTDSPKKSKKIVTGPSCLGRLVGVTGIALLVGVLLAFLWGLKESEKFLPAEEASREVLVNIPEGAGPAKIGEILQGQGVIRSADAFVWAFRLKSRISKKPLNLKAGEMALDPSWSAWEMVSQVAKGNYKLYPFTVPEGRNIYEVADLIAAAGLGSKEEFLALCRDKTFINSLGVAAPTLEGYLFPETYNFPRGTPLKTIVRTMVDACLKVWDKYAKRAEEKGWDRTRVLTLASIVEKETGAPSERPMIAGVFLNRLDKGMKLETDPTVIYGVLPDKYTGVITKSNLKDPNPYNTYVHTGLPPGPITNPGEAAIKAVLEPARVSYIFFVSKNDGTHHFSDTLAEHNKMVQKYQR